VTGFERAFEEVGKMEDFKVNERKVEFLRQIEIGKNEFVIIQINRFMAFLYHASQGLLETQTINLPPKIIALEMNLHSHLGYL
jgi:hypothetical protein